MKNRQEEYETMTKNEVELLLFKVTADGQDALTMKIYKNGTTCRSGVGGLPALGILGMSFFNDSRFFDPLIAKVPDEVLEQPMVYEEETPNGYLECVIAFYGVSNNGDTGERADWSKSTGIRVKLNNQSDFSPPIMDLVERLTMDAAELTNEWYFDVIMNSKYRALSSTLPKETIIVQPKTDKEIDTAFENYINQMMSNPRNWSMKDFDKNKTYEIGGNKYRGVIQQDDTSFSIHFSALSTNSDTNAPNKKS
jgi:hypothetical protein